MFCEPKLYRLTQSWVIGILNLEIWYVDFILYATLVARAEQILCKYQIIFNIYRVEMFAIESVKPLRLDFEHFYIPSV